MSHCARDICNGTTERWHDSFFFILMPSASPILCQTHTAQSNTIKLLKVQRQVLLTQMH